MTTTQWLCPHLDPEAWQMIQRALAFSIRHANRDPETKRELEALHDMVAAIRARNIERRTSAREAQKRYRARQNGQRAEVPA